jgi:hypothetical protein
MRGRGSSWRLGYHGRKQLKQSMTRYACNCPALFHDGQTFLIKSFCFLLQTTYCHPSGSGVVNLELIHRFSDEEELDGGAHMADRLRTTSMEQDDPGVRSGKVDLYCDCGRVRGETGDKCWWLCG